MKRAGLFPVTVVQAGPCTVIQVKTPAKEKYAAVQLGFEERDQKRVKKPLPGPFRKGARFLLSGI